MEEPVVRKPPLVWWAGGLLLGLTQVLAIAVKKPLGVSTQFVVADTMAIREIDPEYLKGHELIAKEKYQELGYGWWLAVGLVAGAFLAAVFTGRWRLRVTTAWWKASGHGVFSRLVAALLGGFLLLMGARLAHGCTSGQFASGWAQLSFSVVPFTVAMFATAMLTARILYPKAPSIER
jgi:uncharacterized membrane protein YedE/YeeE